MKREKLLENRTLNQHPERVSANQIKDFPFLDPLDKAQVKYEMLRAVEVDGIPVLSAAKLFGYSRVSYYHTKEVFEQEGIVSLGDNKPGKKGPTKLTPETIAFIHQQKQKNTKLSGADLAQMVEKSFKITVTKRTVERQLKGMASYKKNST